MTKNDNGLLVLMRHGESLLNREGRFSGWVDCPLTSTGVLQARQSGRNLRAARIGIDICYTSALSRAIDTANAVLAELGAHEIPVRQSWQLNERHYGILEGMRRDEVIRRYGAEQVEAWRNAPFARPPEMSTDDLRHPLRQAVYAGIDPALLPSAESLHDAFQRVVEFFEHEVRPQIESGLRVLVVTHGNPVRALITHLQAQPIDKIPQLNIENALPFVYSRRL